MPSKKVRSELKNMIIEESLQPGWVSKAVWYFGKYGNISRKNHKAKSISS